MKIHLSPTDGFAAEAEDSFCEKHCGVCLGGGIRPVGTIEGVSDLTMLVDSASLIYRAYFSVPDTLRAPDGTSVNAAYGFLGFLARLIAEHRPVELACAWDNDWRPQWRVDLIPGYKTHRVAASEEEPAESIDDQMQIIATLLDLAGIATVGADGYEAEDVIGALLPKVRGRAAIVSGDRDLFQLVRDPAVVVFYPKRGVSDLLIVNEAEIANKYSIPGRGYADFATLRGDPSDGLPGVRGVGEKTAALLISKYGTLESVMEAARGATSGPLAKVDASRDYLERAIKVVRIDSSAPIGKTDVSLPFRPPSPKLKAEAERFGLDGAIDRLLIAIDSR